MEPGLGRLGFQVDGFNLENWKTLVMGRAGRWGQEDEG